MPYSIAARIARTIAACIILILLNLSCALAQIAANAGPLTKKLEIAKAYTKKGSADSAELLFKEIVAEANQTNNAKAFIQAKLSVGRLYADKGENVKAFNEYLLALKKAETINDKSAEAHAYKNIGALYISWKKFDEAISYYEKAEAIARSVGEDELVADCQNNKGTVYEQQLKYDKAIVAYKNAFDVYTAKNITPKISMALSNLAIVYKFQKNYKASLEYDLKAIELSKKTGDDWMLAATYNNTGGVYSLMGDTANAVTYVNKSIELATRIEAMEILESAYDTMSDVYEHAGDYKKALEYHRLFSKTNMKFINLDNTRQLSELNVKYETSQKQKLIQKQQFEISRKNYWLYGSVVLLILVATVAYLIIRGIRLKQEKLLQAEVFKQQEVANSALFQGEQKERIRIARDLHDSIGQMLSVVKMNMSVLQYQDENNTVVNNAIGIVDKTIAEVRDISHNLLPGDLNLGLFTALEYMCNKISAAGVTTVELIADEEATDVKLNPSSELSVYRIVQEVLGNMLKHAGATHIDVAVAVTAGELDFSISDNGQGFDTDKINTSAGIGWKNISARINFLRGRLNVWSQPQKGTRVNFTVPAS